MVFSFVVLLALVCQIGYSVNLSHAAFQEGKGLQKPSVTHYGSLDATAVQALFDNFIYEYNKVYLTSAEKERRLKIFTENLKRYDEMNKWDMGTATYGVDRFSDMSVEEFRDKMLTLDADAMRDLPGELYDVSQLENVRAPKNFDWRKKGAVTPVKNQGNCGSCWAFSTTGNLEGLYKLKHKKLLSFSEQQLVDCDKTCGGCDGGWMLNALDYIKEAGGLQSNETYPYVANDQQCTFNKANAIVKVKSSVVLPERNEIGMLKYLFKNGPFSVALDANAMLGYRNGIAHPPEWLCSKNETKVNHGITMVGFGVKVVDDLGKVNGKKKIPFWIAKNSWSDRWGDKGYYYLYRGDGSCAIDRFPNSAIIE